MDRRSAEAALRLLDLVWVLGLCSPPFASIVRTSALCYTALRPVRRVGSDGEGMCRMIKTQRVSRQRTRGGSLLRRETEGPGWIEIRKQDKLQVEKKVDRSITQDGEDW
jgi:hypothetical protein